METVAECICPCPPSFSLRYRDNDDEKRAMFSILDVEGPANSTTAKSSADRACDQCKLRKVKCTMTKPCKPCETKRISCTYDRARKKRGPAGKRMSMPGSFQRSVSVSDPDLDSPPSQHLERVTTAPVQQQPSMWPTQEQSYEETMAYSANAHQSAPQDQAIPMDLGSVSENESCSGASAMSTTATVPIVARQEHMAPTAMSAASAILSNHRDSITSPNAFMFPSMPVESPSGWDDPFASIIERDLPTVVGSNDIWPAKVNETTLLPWIDVYFKRLHPTIPILNRTNMYCDMLLRKHRIDAQYGAMLLGLCAFAMTQPVHIHERASMPSRSVQARMLMDECVQMRSTADFGEYPTIEMVLASFFLFACLFGSNQHKAARHRLQEAVDLAQSLGLHLPASYAGLSDVVREQWLRTYLVLSVTERAYALQKNHAINFRGQPGVTARFMQAFGPATSEYIASLIFKEQTDAVAMTGLLYLMDSFDAIDERIADCWSGYCSYSDGMCETFDRRKALQMFRAQRRVREACIAGNISFAPTVTPLPLAQLLESQRADISVTQFWLLNRLWQLCLTHQLLREVSDHPELRYDFACEVASALLDCCNNLTLAAMEVHGVGLAEKIYDVGVGLVTALQHSSQLKFDTGWTRIRDDGIPGSNGQQGSTTVRDLFDGLLALLRDFRGGDHPYVSRLDVAWSSLPVYAT